MSIPEKLKVPEQFDKFHEIVCPKCGKKIDTEIIINQVTTK